MLNDLLKIAKLCDRRNEWDEEEWLSVLRRCIAKSQYIVKIKNREIVAFSCWLFLKDLEKVDNKYIEDENGTIAYVQAAYVKEGNKGLLFKMMKEGIEKHPQATHIFFCDDRQDNRKFLIPIRRGEK